MEVWHPEQDRVKKALYLSRACPGLGYAVVTPDKRAGSENPDTVGFEPEVVVGELLKGFMRARVLFSLVAFSASTVALAADAPHEAIYVVKDGDTLSGIAHRNHVSLRALRLLNGLDENRSVRVGKSLRVPAPEDKSDGPVVEAANLGNGATPAPHANGMRRGVVRLVRGQETLQTRVLDRRNRVVANTLSELTRFLRFPDGSSHPVDPRLVKLIATVSDHFEGREIVVISGFRPYTTRQFTPHSNHNVGRAIDFSVRGIPNEAVRDFCRQFPNVGVGYYPNSSFVHLDVRSASAFWIDYAASGQAPRYHRPESKDEADEGAGEVEGVATVDHPEGAQSGSTATSTGASATFEKQSGKATSAGSLSEHSVFQGQP